MIKINETITHYCCQKKKLKKMFKNVKNLTRDVVVGVFLIVVGVFSFPVGVGGRGRGFLDTRGSWLSKRLSQSRFNH